MKNLLMFVVLFMVGSIIVGCAKHTPPTQLEVAAQQDMNVTVSECYRTRAVVEGSMYTALASIPSEDRALVLVLLQQNNSSRELVAAATGNSIDPCGGGTNMFDVDVAELRAQAEQTKAYVGVAKWAVGAAATAYVASDLLDSLGGTAVTYAASENGKINVNSQNQDSGNVVSGNYNKTGDNVVTNTNEDMIESERVTDNSNDNNAVCEIDADCEDGQTCSDGVCIGDPGDPDPFDLGSCLENPPGGWVGELAMWNDVCSCTSKAAGHCN